MLTRGKEESISSENDAQPTFNNFLIKTFEFPSKPLLER